MRGTKKDLLILVLGLVGIGLSLVPQDAIKIFGAVLAGVALIWGFARQGAARIPFTSDRWEAAPDGDGLQLVIPRTKHGRAAPNAAVYVRDPAGHLTEAGCQVNTNSSGDVTIKIGGLPFEGEVRIT